jgi:hypothetical protein
MFPLTVVYFASLFDAAISASVIPTNFPKPGQSSYDSTYHGNADVYPANITKAAILPTARGDPGPDDLLFQNLLSAEWVIYSFYQQGVERFNTSAFVAAGFPITTYDRISEIRDNEAGHLAIFLDKISSTSIKPGACEYVFPFTGVTSYLELGTLLEVSSMAFLTGLILQADLDTSKSALVAVAETESRHNTWSLMDIWKASPFAGPSDTIFPYANEILESTNAFVIPRSCPAENPRYPRPSQNLPALSYKMANGSIAQPGSKMQFGFPDEKNQPKFEQKKEYFLVAFHGLVNVSAPYDVDTSSAVLPDDTEAHKGIIILVIAAESGAPGLDSIVAGPLILPQW